MSILYQLYMPNKPSATKELRKAKKRTLHNVKIKTHVKTLFAHARDLVEKGDSDGAKKAMIVFQKAMDKAAKVNVVSKNRANRKKSVLMKLVGRSKVVV